MTDGRWSMCGVDSAAGHELEELEATASEDELTAERAVAAPWLARSPKPTNPGPLRASTSPAHGVASTTRPNEIDLARESKVIGSVLIPTIPSGSFLDLGPSASVWASSWW